MLCLFLLWYTFLRREQHWIWLTRHSRKRKESEKMTQNVQIKQLWDLVKAQHYTRLNECVISLTHAGFNWLTRSKHILNKQSRWGKSAALVLKMFKYINTSRKTIRTNMLQRTDGLGQPVDEDQSVFTHTATQKKMKSETDIQELTSSPMDDLHWFHLFLLFFFFLLHPNRSEITWGMAHMIKIKQGSGDYLFTLSQYVSNVYLRKLNYCILKLAMTLKIMSLDHDEQFLWDMA